MHDDFNDAFDKIDAAVATMPRIVAGSYAGSGSCGASSPTSLTFDFEPKAVIIISDYVATFAVFIRPCNLYYSPGADSSTLNVTWTGNTVRWYTTQSYAAGAQMNNSSSNYFYIAIG